MTNRHSGGQLCNRVPADTAVPTAPVTSDWLTTRHGSGMVDGSQANEDAAGAAGTAFVDRGAAHPPAHPPAPNSRANAARPAAGRLIRTTLPRTRNRPL